jgi:hypothetical protein
MDCHGFRKGIQTAASGEESTGIVREHLNSCFFCRAMFGRERVLFSSIDGVLRASVNGELPNGLLQRMQPIVEASACRDLKT